MQRCSLRLGGQLHSPPGLGAGTTHSQVSWGSNRRAKAWPQRQPQRAGTPRHWVTNPSQVPSPDTPTITLRGPSYLPPSLQPPPSGAAYLRGSICSLQPLAHRRLLTSCGLPSPHPTPRKAPSPDLAPGSRPRFSRRTQAGPHPTPAPRPSHGQASLSTPAHSALATPTPLLGSV